MEKKKHGQGKEDTAKRRAGRGWRSYTSTRLPAFISSASPRKNSNTSIYALCTDFSSEKEAHFDDWLVQMGALSATTSASSGTSSYLARRNVNRQAQQTSEKAIAEKGQEKGKARRREGRVMAKRTEGERSELIHLHRPGCQHL